MRHNTVRRRVDSVLAPDQFRVARPLRLEDLDRQATQHGIYPSLPATNGVPWSEYVRTQEQVTDSPIPYFQPIERGYMSEGSQEGVYVPPYVDPSEHTIDIGGTDYHPDITETDKVSTYTGLDDYDTLFAARHGRGALDPVPRMSEQMITATSMGITAPTASMGLMVNPIGKGEAYP